MEWFQVELWRVLVQIIMTNNNKSLGTHGDIHPGVAGKLSYKIAEILTKVCYLLPKADNVNWHQLLEKPPTIILGSADEWI